MKYATLVLKRHENINKNQYENERKNKFIFDKFHLDQ